MVNQKAPTASRSVKLWVVSAVRVWRNTEEKRELATTKTSPFPLRNLSTGEQESGIIHTWFARLRPTNRPTMRLCATEKGGARAIGLDNRRLLL
jgi:hypothetical protein